MLGHNSKKNININYKTKKTIGIQYLSLQSFFLVYCIYGITRLVKSLVLYMDENGYQTIPFGSIALMFSSDSNPFSFNTSLMVLFSSSAFIPICDAIS